MGKSKENIGSKMIKISLKELMGWKEWIYTNLACISNCCCNEVKKENWGKEKRKKKFFISLLFCSLKKRKRRRRNNAIISKIVHNRQWNIHEGMKDRKFKFCECNYLNRSNRTIWNSSKFSLSFNSFWLIILRCVCAELALNYSTTESYNEVTKPKNHLRISL